MFEHLTITQVVIFFVSLVLSITLHESMHAFAGYWLGDNTAKEHGRISLNPIRHIDPYMTIMLPFFTLLAFGRPMLVAKPVPFNPNRVRFGEFGAALVGVAGPLTNLLLALVGAGLLHILFGVVSSTIAEGLLVFVGVNIALFIFNMIPIPPLDGSRLVYAFAPEPLQEVMASLERWGFFVIIGLIILVPAFGDFVVHLNQSLLNLIIR